MIKPSDTFERIWGILLFIFPVIILFFCGTPIGVILTRKIVRGIGWWIMFATLWGIWGWMLYFSKRYWKVNYPWLDNFDEMGNPINREGVEYILGGKEEADKFLEEKEAMGYTWNYKQRRWIKEKQ